MLKVLDLFSGIGGFSLGLEATGGFETAAFCEIDPFCQKVLKKHWPDVPIYEDVRTIDYDGPIDLISGGFPCQPASLAGKRQGTEDDRWLWPEMFACIKRYKPSWVIGENVYGIISMGLDDVLSDLESEDYAVQTFIIPACAVNAPHRRDRVWIVANDQGNGCRQRGSRGSNTGRQGQPEQTLQDVANAKGKQSSSCDNGREQGEARNQEQGKSGRGGGGQDVADPERERGRSWDPRWQNATDVGQPSGSKGINPRTVGFWDIEPNVGRVVARVSPRLDGGGLDEASEGTTKIMWALRGELSTQEIQWPVRGLGSIQTPEILLAELCKYEGSPKTLGNVSLESQKTSEITMRGVWFEGQTACPSCKRKAEEQRSREHPDLVHLLSQLLACDCGSTWLDRAGTPSNTSKTDRLKSLGNAVVPQIPYIIGRGILNVEMQNRETGIQRKTGEDSSQRA